MNPASPPYTHVIGHTQRSHYSPQHDGCYQDDFPHRWFASFIWIQQKTKCSVKSLHAADSHDHTHTQPVTSPPCSFTIYGPGVVSKFWSSATTSATSGAGHILSSTASPSVSSYCGLSTGIIHWPWMYRGTPADVSVSRACYRGRQDPTQIRFNQTDQTFSRLVWLFSSYLTEQLMQPKEPRTRD